MDKIYEIVDSLIDYYDSHKKCAVIMLAALAVGLVVGYLIGG